MGSGPIDFRPNFAATAVGSMSHQDAHQACREVTRHLREVPAWPQLPKRSFLENMYVQFSEGFPGVVLERDRIYVDRSQDLEEPLERLYTAYLEERLEPYASSVDYTAGLYAFLETKPRPALAVKGQVTGPISWGLTVTDQERRPILYDEVLADALAKHLRLKAAWQEKALRSLCPQIILFLDEPYMSAYGSAFVSLSREQVITYLEEVFRGLRGLKGIHCCGNTDWSILLETSLDILNFDAYNCAESIALYPEEVASFLERGGIIAWGIVPSDEGPLSEEGLESLVARLEKAMDGLARKGISLERILERCLITPSCGLSSLSPEMASRALELTQALSLEMRRRYGGEG